MNPEGDNGASSEPLPGGAQVSLQKFQLPEFPPEASHLIGLTLTSDVKPTEYSTLLSTPLAPEAIPASIPADIESLTLELFSLGYPAPFLTELGKALPNLKSLTIYSQLIDGVGDESRKDAGEFFNDVLVGKGRKSGGLRELHLLDVFCRKGFMAGLGAILEDLHETDAEKSVLRFLEISYTYRGHSDPEFLNRILGDELPTLLSPSLMAASFNLAAAPASSSASDSKEEPPSDPADVDENGVPIPGRRPEGIMPLAQTSPGTVMLVKKLAGNIEETEMEKSTKDDDEPRAPGSGPGPRSLKLLDTTLYSIDLTQFGDVISSQKGLSVLSASVVVSPTEYWKDHLLEVLRRGKDLEIIEIVGVPNEEFDKEVSFFYTVSSPISLFPTNKDIDYIFLRHNSHCLPREGMPLRFRHERPSIRSLSQPRKLQDEHSPSS